MSIRNFPKIPKIILRKSADQAKGEKKSIVQTAILICARCDVLLRGATLKVSSRLNCEITVQRICQVEGSNMSYSTKKVELFRRRT